ncbi:MAG: branched-chain amino acid ABC transporter permease [Burkholderiales bacterium]
MSTAPRTPLWPGIAAAALVTAFAVAFMWAENEWEVIGVLAAAVAAVLVARRTGWLAPAARAFEMREPAMNCVALAALLVFIAVFHDDHFPLLMVGTVLIYFTVCLGLTLQFGYSGVMNFAPAAFLGTGCYTAAVLSVHSAIPHLALIALGGAVAALVGSILILPVLRTRGHYAAVVTIAFGLLFKTFLEVNDTLGGPQGLKLPSMKLMGIAFNDNFSVAGVEFSFYTHYVLAALALAVLAFAFTRRLERSWIGLSLDAIRLDETAAACFGIHIARWKILAFTLGNFMAGAAGALYALMLGFIAPTSFTFGDSLVMVSIVLLGGIGNPWGAALAAAIVVVLPEKLQLIQEYRYLLYAALVILVLLYRPEGLLPRPLRAYLPGWRAR